MIHNYLGFPRGISGADLARRANITVRCHAEVVGGVGDRRLTHLRPHDRSTGDTGTVPVAGLFVLIGAEPRTEWLPDEIERDTGGYILTGMDRPGRPAWLFETSVSGVFAVGDVRHGSVKRVASAVGEGAVAIRMVHECLRQV
jgi:thioredoxin reductase (NADPH)